MKRTYQVLRILGILYLGIAYISLKFRHPEMGAADLMVHTFDAILFREVP